MCIRDSGIFSHLFRDYGPYAGDITTRTTGTLVSMETGVSTPFALVVALSCAILMLGATKGIERINKVLMPAFFILFAILAVRVAFLPSDRRIPPPRGTR